MVRRQQNKIKQKNANPINGEFYIQQNCPSKKNERN